MRPLVLRLCFICCFHFQAPPRRYSRAPDATTDQIQSVTLGHSEAHPGGVRSWNYGCDGEPLALDFICSCRGRSLKFIPLPMHVPHINPSQFCETPVRHPERAFWKHLPSLSYVYPRIESIFIRRRSGEAVLCTWLCRWLGRTWCRVIKCSCRRLTMTSFEWSKQTSARAEATAVLVALIWV